MHLPRKRLNKGAARRKPAAGMVRETISPISLPNAAASATAIEDWKVTCDALAEAALVMDERGTVRHANRAAADLLGIEQGSLTGHTCSELFHGSCSPPPDCPHRRFQITGKPHRGNLKAAQGAAYDLAVAPAILSAHGVSGCIATLRDSNVPLNPQDLLREQIRLTDRVRSLEQRLRHLALLSEMEDVAQTCRESDELFRILGGFAEKLFHDSSGVLRVFVPGNATPHVVAGWGEDLPAKLRVDKHECIALRDNRVSDSDSSGELCAHLRGAANASLCVPILTPGENLGALQLFSQRLVLEPQGLEDGIRLQAITAAQYLGRAIASVRLREALRLESIRDPLTGLFNRRYMEEALERELHRAHRSNSQLSLIMLDVDHFKRFNDTRGHADGDSLLRALGQLLQSRTRHEDIACRFGGEEFLLILPETPLEVALRRAEFLRDESRRIRIGAETAHDEITLSLGVATFPRDGESVPELVRAADRQLYRAKHGGRDRVSSAGDQALPVAVLSSE